MAGGDDHGIDIGVVQHGICLAARIGRPGIFLHGVGGDAARRYHAPDVETAGAGQRRHQHRLGEVAGADDAEPDFSPVFNRALQFGGRRRRRMFRCPHAEGQQHADGEFAFRAGHQFVSVGGLLNGKPVRGQGLHVQLPRRRHLQKRRHVAAFGPAHVTDRIIAALFLVIGIIAAGAVGPGLQDFQFLFEINVARDIHLDVADNDDLGPVAAMAGDHGKGRAGIPGPRRQQHRINPKAVGGGFEVGGQGRIVRLGRDQGALLAGQFQFRIIQVEADDLKAGGATKLQRDLSDQP